MKPGCIFDMDGVLVDSSAAHYQSWSRLGEEIGAAFPRALFDRTFGMHNNQIIPTWLERSLAPGELERLGLRKEALYREAAPAVLQPLPGAVDLVRALVADGFALAVGSSGPAANVRLVLELLGVADCFAALSSGDEVHHGKPHPEIFLNAARHLALPPASCVVIEDAPQGVEAGHRAGARVVAVTSSRPRADLADADVVVDSLTEVTPTSLRALLRR